MSWASEMAKSKAHKLLLLNLAQKSMSKAAKECLAILTAKLVK
jgi:hypothetical protein